MHPQPAGTPLQDPGPIARAAHHQDSLGQRPDPGHRHGAHLGTLRRAPRWERSAGPPRCVPRSPRPRASPARPHHAVQRHLPYRSHIPARFDRNVAAGGQSRESHRQIETRPLLGHIARAQIDGDAPGGQSKAAAGRARPDAFPGFAHRRARKAHDGHAGQAASGVSFDPHGDRLDAHQGETPYGSQTPRLRPPFDRVLEMLEAAGQTLAVQRDHNDVEPHARTEATRLRPTTRGQRP